ncbi:MAG: ABC transporter substrate-binding protein [Spirochaetaceae bacterium]
MKKIIASLMLFSIIITGFSYGEDYDFVSIENLIEQKIGRLIILEIYKKLDLEVSITPVPGIRAQQLAISGKKDGEIMRIYSYGEENPTSVRVPTPYYYLETMGFIKKDSGIVINNKEDLINYRVGKVRGVKHTNNITEGLDDVVNINTTLQMIKMLENKRIDIALTNTVDGLIAIKKLGYTDIIPFENPLAVLDLFHYIYVSKSEIVPIVDNAIKEMIESGEMKKVITIAEKKIISGN